MLVANNRLIVPAVLASAAAFVWSTQTATAAVRLCKPMVMGAAKESKDELEAKKQALESWLGLAIQYGDQFTSWRLAERRSLGCRQIEQGMVQCQAAAQPCTISQVPPSPGSESKPDVNPKRKRGGLGV
jgi:hypothetical protein